MIRTTLPQIIHQLDRTDVSPPAIFRLVLAFQIFTFLLLFPVDTKLHGTIYELIREYGLSQLTTALAIWLAISTVALLGFVMVCWGLRSERLKFHWVDVALAVSWLVIFWGYFIFFTPLVLFLLLGGTPRV